jgi:hypothetical protein
MYSISYFNSEDNQASFVESPKILKSAFLITIKNEEEEKKLEEERLSNEYCLSKGYKKVNSESIKVDLHICYLKKYGTIKFIGKVMYDPKFCDWVGM